MPGTSHRQQWSWFVLGVGLVLLVLCAAAPSAVALILGVVLVLAGVLGLVVGA